MKKTALVITAIIAGIFCMSCNDSISSSFGGEKRDAKDRSRRTVIDAQEYVDFTTAKHDALTHKREKLLYNLGGKAYKNGFSTIKMNAADGTIEISSSGAKYNGEGNLAVYAKFGMEVMAASGDCLYIRRNFREPGVLIIGDSMYKDDQIPDLAVCIPLYGYSKNRIEVSPVMDGYILMPSGTYWRE